MSDFNYEPNYNLESMKLSSEALIVLQIIQYIFTIIGFCYVSYSIICSLTAPPEGFEYDSDEDDVKCKETDDTDETRSGQRYKNE
jgi:hypothetical protein